jgi:hypothetical protein
MSIGDPPSEQAPLCARCGQPLTPGEPSVTLAGGTQAHQRCADVDAAATTRQPPRPRPPRRLSERLAHTSLPKRRRR